MNWLVKYIVITLLFCFSLISHAEKPSMHHDFPAAVASFHDVLSPLWHAPMDEQRAPRICKQSAALSSTADAILLAITPAGVSGEQWGVAVDKLRQSVAVIAKHCANNITAEPALVNAALVDVHNQFHVLVRFVGHEHSMASPPSPAELKNEDNDYLIVSEAFSECAALQNTLADLASNSEEEYENHVLHQSGQEAFIIATDFAVAAGREQALAQFQYEHHISRFKSILEKSESGYENFSVEVQPIINKCAGLNRIQTHLISERSKQNNSDKQ